MKKWFIISVPIILGIVITLLIVLSNRHPQKHPTLVTVIRGNLSETAIAAGNIVPKKTVTIKSEVPGIAKTITVQAGDPVKQGELLIKIQQNKTPEKQTELLSSFRKSQTEKDTAKQRLDNYNYLLKNDLIKSNYNDYAQTKKEYEIQSIDYQLKKQQLDLYQKGETTAPDGRLIKSEVTSPVKGYILRRLINEGDVIISTGDNQAATLLFTVADMHDLLFKGAVDERYASQLHVTQPAIITIAALPDVKIHGKITSVALQSDQENQKLKTNGNSSENNGNSPFNVGFQIEIGKLDIPKNIQLLSGYSAIATVTLKTEKNALLIPERTLMSQNGKITVKLYQGEHKPIKIVPVTLGISDASRVEVTHGLTEGDQIIDISATNSDE